MELIKDYDVSSAFTFLEDKTDEFVDNLIEKYGSDLNLITLGKPPNKRVDLLLKAIEYSQKQGNTS